ncbi:MAG: quinol:electron acceptor oxidoreductase subunit ActD [Dehalococcoidia bacterium]
MANQKLLGLFQDPQKVADAVTSFKESDFPVEDLDIYSGTPYPEGTFGEHDPAHRLYLFPMVGALVGFALGLLYTAGTQISYPLITGGKPILAIPPMTIILYENIMLGAIIFTVLGVLFESRLPKRNLGLYDTRITEGYIGLIVDCPDTRLGEAERLLTTAGAEEIKRENAVTSV